MSEDRPPRPLIYEDDDSSIYDLIQTIGHGQGHKLLSRPTKHHIKYGLLNFFPSTGAITIDGEGRHAASGAHAFENLAFERYPEPQCEPSPCASAPTPERIHLRVDETAEDESDSTERHLRLGHDDDGSVPW